MRDGTFRLFYIGVDGDAARLAQSTGKGREDAGALRGSALATRAVMLERLQALPLLILGGLLTRACAMFGLAGLLSLSSGARREPAPGSITANSIAVKHRNVYEMAGLVRALRSRSGVTTAASPRTLRIAGPPAEVVRLARVVREIDQPANAGQRIWTVGACAPRDKDLARMWAGWWDWEHGWRPPARVTRIIRDDRHDQLIVVGNEAGYQRVARMCLYEPHDESP